MNRPAIGFSTYAHPSQVRVEIAGLRAMGSCLHPVNGSRCALRIQPGESLLAGQLVRLVPGCARGVCRYSVPLPCFRGSRQVANQVRTGCILRSHHRQYPLPCRFRAHPGVCRPFRTAHEQGFDGSPAFQSTPVLGRLCPLQLRISRSCRSRICDRRLRRRMRWTGNMQRIIQILAWLLPTRVAGCINTAWLVLLLRSRVRAFAVQ